MRSSLGFRFFIVAALTLLMVIPLVLASDVVNSRKEYSRSTIAEVGREWGGAQTVSGPLLVVPVEQTFERTVQEEVVDTGTGIVQKDADGRIITRVVTRYETVRNRPIHALPNRYDVTIDSVTQIRHRGLFNVPVYQASVAMAFDFPLEQIAAAATIDEDILWNEARLVMNISSNAALRGVAELTAGDAEIAIEPLASATDLAGIEAALGDPRGIEGYRLQLGLNGAQSLQISPVGRQTSVQITSDWPHPSFTGGFLPDSFTVSGTGFEALWTIPHLARTLPQIAREDYTSTMRGEMAFGVDLFEPNDFYQKAYRAAKYGVLFIALTFLTVLLIDRTTDRPAHPVQYVLIGLAQSVFVLLMVAYAEQIGFTPAYVLAAVATILLITLFGWVGLKLAGRTLVLFAMLVVLYAVLYLILKSADYALLAGSTLAFIALAATMWLTRDEDWYGPEGSGRLFGKKPTPVPGAPAPDGPTGAATKSPAPPKA